MKCPQIQERFPDYLAAELAVPENSAIELHLAHCPACRAELAGLRKVWEGLRLLPSPKPSATASARFHTMLEAYQHGMRQAEREARRQPGFLSWWTGSWAPKPAWQFSIALALFVLGWILGPASRPISQDPTPPGASAELALQELRQEVSSLRQSVTLALLQQPSATERLRGVTSTYQLDQPDTEILGALLRALDLDPNVNVRLAAVDALQQFATQASVRQGLLRSLAEQKSPLVQIQLIDLMVELKEHDSLPVLKRLSQDPETHPAVRDRAEWGLQQLA